MKTSVVILNWNGRDFLEKFLPSLLCHTPAIDTELVVADNGSTDDSLAFVQTTYPTIRIVRLDRNYGFAEGYNRALAQIDADYYVLLNSDVEVTSRWLEPLIAHLDSHPATVACQPKILAYHRKTHFEHAGAAGGMLDHWGYPYCRGRMFDHVEEDCGQYDTETREIFWATGACFAVRASVYHEMGGLDPIFFAHQEEIDLCWRMKSRGHSVVCVPTSRIYHVGGGTLATDNPRKTHLNFRNNLLMLYKNLPTRRWWMIMVVRFVLDYAAALQMLVSGKEKNAKAVVSARRDFWHFRAQVRKARRTNLTLATTAHPEGLTRRMIVWDYYVKRVTR